MSILWQPTDIHASSECMTRKNNGRSELYEESFEPDYFDAIDDSDKNTTLAVALSTNNDKPNTNING